MKLAESITNQNHVNRQGIRNSGCFLDAEQHKIIVIKKWFMVIKLNPRKGLKNNQNFRNQHF